MNFAIYEQADESPEVKLNLFSLSMPVHIYVCYCISIKVALVVISEYHLFKGGPWTSETEM